MKWSTINWVDLIIYIVLIIIVLLLIFYNERRALDNINETVSAPRSSTTFNETVHLLYNPIIWRRSLITAIIAGFIILYVIEMKIPQATKLLTVIVILYIFIYVMLSFYRTTATISLMNYLLEF